MFHRLLLLLVLAFATTHVLASDGFPRPAELERDIAFWRRIYTEVGTDGGLIHDPVRLDVVYEKIRLPADLSPKERSNRIDDIKRKYSRILDRLAAGATDLSAEEQRVHDLWPKGTRRSRFEQASEEVRFQLGQADRFLEGVIRSGAYKPHIEKTFAKMGLPTELAALPHVESSFNTYAYSKVGAAGMWQFMRATGRRFMRIDSVVDERLDPYVATEAAGKFLEQNYIVLDSWPLALTAYNHGTAGMRRAKEQMGTSDITTIVRNYSSRSFGFASRNFYVAFLAALEIDADPARFFGPIKLDPVDNSQTLSLANYVPATQLAAALQVDRDLLRKLNPSLLPSVWNGSRHVPRGFDFRIPASVDMNAVVARLSNAASFDAQVADTHHKVGKGETLSVIASRYGVSMNQLAEMNGLRRPYQIRIGQVLTLPVKPGAAPPTAAVAQAEKEPPKREAVPTGVVGSEKYVVKRGDTLSRIASRHGLTEQALMDMNDIRNRNFVYEGQVLALVASARVAPPVEASVPVDTVTPAPTAEVAAVAEAVEPASEKEAEEIGPTLLPGAQAASSADPADYSVHDGNTIRVQAAETIGHYAEWLEVRGSQVRKLNRMTAATPVVIGRKLKMDFSKVTPDQFEARRTAYHRQLQEAFFTEFRISGDVSHTVKSGESIWVLAQQRYNIPIWLLRQYNPDVDLGAVRPGTKLVIPTVAPVNGGAAGGSD
ncbi:MAG TPA: LysM peptidoglycan-binding domain-containing protein [Povalibacter sp.]|uniref:LysM peptidoglycan-binding domain-containing protein n=1 Tax=Povalibacter sp. TaxID=1962978 RepID=UPI002B80E3D2|nr:LysM peptidoglycan-binding domain-containing protein [Povalibacter sp.]HMN43861.1 LysM peptidoglycan-binding domain-containing protein [Povalibacter sp.]